MQTGTVIADRFTVESLAGSGGMGSVYRARDVTTDATVAVKVLNGTGPRDADRFLREARLLAELRHEAIVRYVSHGAMADGTLYLAMEWLEGEDLAQRLESGPLTIAETIAMIDRVASALSLVHEHGIVHRDLKPGNLFLPNRAVERVTLLDFGIARTEQRSRAMTRTGVLLGTPGYMAPEQARGERALDSRIDVFALGCVLFECLAGRAAFVGDNVMAVLAKVLLEEAPRVREFRPDVPAALESLLARMLAKNPEKRPADGAAVCAAIRSLDSARPATNVAPRDRGSALTDDEQRLLCVVIATPRGRVDESAATVEQPGDGGALRERVRAIAAPFDAAAEVLLDGTAVVTLAGGGSAGDQVTRAARCALALRSEWPGVPVVLATGRGVLGARLPFGEVIDRATSLVARVGANGVNVDDLTAGLLESRFEVTRTDVGLELRGERHMAASARTLLGRPSPCVGRERELRAFADIYDECIAEPVARAVLVTAAAGVGKSRLRHECIRALTERENPPEIWLSRADPVGAGSAFGMLGQIVRDAAGITASDAIAAQRERLCARVSRHAAPAEITRITEFLGEIAGLGFSDDASPQLKAARGDAVLMGDQMARAWQDFLAAECAVRPIVIVMEDLHWGDLPSIGLLDATLRNLRDAPIMLFALARPEVHQIFPALWSERDVQEVRLATLTRRAAERLVRDALGVRADERTVARLLERAGGNAFYLEELIRAVAEGQGDNLPGTVLAMVLSRLEAFDAETRRVLRAASVFGETFWHGGLVALLGADAPVEDLGRTLEALIAREVITRAAHATLTGETAYGFRHALVRDAAYSMLTDQDRALGHCLAGEWLERAGETDALVLAEHFDRGQAPARAIEYYRRSAEQALEGNDMARAIARTSRAIELGAEGEVLASLLLVAAEAHEWRGEAAESMDRAERAMALFGKGTARWFRAASSLLGAADRLGIEKRMDELFLTVHGTPWAPDGKVAAIAFLQRAAAAFASRSRVDQFQKLVAENRSAFKDYDGLDLRTRATALMSRTFLAFTSGSDPIILPATAAAVIDELAATGEERNAAHLWANLSMVCRWVGDYDLGETLLRKSIAVSERLGLKHVLGLALHGLGNVLSALARYSEAREVEMRALALVRSLGNKRLEIAAQVYLADICLRSGDITGCLDATRSALESELVPHLRADALSLRARALLRQGDTPAAIDTVQEAVAIVRALPVVLGYQRVQVTLTMSAVREAAGDHDGAVACLREACDSIRSVAARFTDDAARTRFLERVPDNAHSLALARAWGIADDAPAPVPTALR